MMWAMSNELTPQSAQEILDQVASEELRLQFDHFDASDAWRLGVQIVDAARARELPIVISVRRGGQRLFHAALPGTSASNDRWIERKSAVVELFGHASFHVAAQLLLDESSLEHDHGLDPGAFAAHGGVFPIIVRGVGAIGTVGVSGLPQADDHAFVVDQLEAFLGAEDRQPR